MLYNHQHNMTHNTYISRYVYYNVCEIRKLKLISDQESIVSCHINKLVCFSYIKTCIIGIWYIIVKIFI